MLAKWSLLCIVQACSGAIRVLRKSLADGMITDALVRRPLSVGAVHLQPLFTWYAPEILRRLRHRRRV